MKKLLILFLLIALGAGAYLSRPDYQNFQHFIAAGPVEQTFEGMGRRIIIQVEPGQMDEQYIFRDHYLFTAIEQEGQKAYIGLFGQWFRWAKEPEPQGQVPVDELSDSDLSED